MLEAVFDEPPFLIKKLLWEKDNVIVLGDAKTGKSLWTLQIACALTSGEDFLDEYKVSRKCNVLYVQAEGKMYESCARLKNMQRGVPSDPSLLRWLHVPHLPMDRPDSADRFKALVEENFGDFIPDVIIFDPLYMMVSTGSLKEDDVSRNVTANFNIVKTIYNCAIILNHHQHRPKKKKNSSADIDEGDQSIFGSFVWRAWPDHILQWKKKNDVQRVLTCDTQRSGNVVNNVNIIFNQPNPLYFELDEDNKTVENSIIVLARNREYFGPSEVKELSNGNDSKVKRAIRKMTTNGTIERVSRGLYRAKIKENV